MLRIMIDSIEIYDEITGKFGNSRSYDLSLEHSLISISKWEATWRKPFLSTVDKTRGEILDYVRCMTMTNNIDPEAYLFIKPEVMDKISAYINAPMTATIFGPDPKHLKKQIITSEIIYYWMVSFNIPFDCERWHLNRLLTLIRVCSIKAQPEKKRSKQEIFAEQRALNEARKAQLNTRG